MASGGVQYGVANPFAGMFTPVYSAYLSSANV
jgi:hypothetical protein